MKAKEGKGKTAAYLAGKLWYEEQAQDVAEYAMMLAVILVIVMGTMQLIGASSNTVFSTIGSALQ
jgi:Flp pilus assembly pilin Flp